MNRETSRRVCLVGVKETHTGEREEEKKENHTNHLKNPKDEKVIFGGRR